MLLTSARTPAICCMPLCCTPIVPQTSRFRQDQAAAHIIYLCSSLLKSMSPAAQTGISHTLSTAIP